MEFLKKFRNWKDIVEHPSETVIFQEGSPAEYLYVIIAGEVELTLRKEPLVIESAGGIIGETALFELATRNATATTLSDVKLARVNRDQLGELMKESTEFSLQLMSVLANRLRAVNNYISSQLGPV
jgi:CRP/FNR family cyclic AMP-dependent transcriptional regulator